MALKVFEFTFNGNADYKLPENWSHTGVVGSGDLEILIEPAIDDGKVKYKVVTPISGYENIWEKVLEKFTADNEIGNLKIEINDNNATPFVVLLRLKQALINWEEN